MKTIRSNVILLILSVLVLYGCTRQKEPTVRLLNGRFMTGNVEITPGGVLQFKWMAEKGKSDLTSFTIRVNGDDLSGYGYPVTQIPPDVYIDSTFMEGPAARGDYTYAFIAGDADGNFGEKAIVVSVQ
jgi:hypothetical protein